MRKENGLIEEEWWNAVISCDKNYDGLFYYAVKTTGIFCRPSCRAKAPLKKNTLFFNNVNDAVKEGFRPCKLCRPDMRECNYEPNKELVEKVKEWLDISYNKSLNLKETTKNFGISLSHLTRLFKEYYGMTPNEYIVQIRINKSIQLLSESNLDILEIAYEVGFKSLSSFYKYFNEQVGCRPKEYRKNKSKIDRKI